MSEKIISLEVENFKNIRAITVNFDQFNVIGGANKAGKTSTLDAICFALGGSKYKPTNPKREGAVSDTSIKLTTSSGLVVERVGKNLSLKVTDPTGEKKGQSLLNNLIDDFALNMPKFLASSDTEKANVFLNRDGLGDALDKLEKKFSQVYSERQGLASIVKAKKGHVEEMPAFENVPEEQITVQELVNQQQAILLKNAENQKARGKVQELEERLANGRLKKQSIVDRKEALLAELKDLNEREENLDKKLDEFVELVESSKKSAEQLQDESDQEIKDKILEIEVINSQVRANLDKKKAIDEANEYKCQYDLLTKTIADIREEQNKLLNSIEFPLDGLSIVDKKLNYNGIAWDGLSGSEQIIVGTAIAKQLNPNQGFVLVDKLEQMDDESLKKYCEICKNLDLQMIGTKVSKGDECSIIIEDGEVVKASEYFDGNQAPQAPAAKAEQVIDYLDDEF